MTDRETVTAWMRAGTTMFTRQVSALSESGARAPSRLDGWTRAHVVAHVARNAEALARLAAWAHTGIETPMYSGPAQRADDIETTAAYGLDRLVARPGGGRHPAGGRPRGPLRTPVEQRGPHRAG